MLNNIILTNKLETIEDSTFYKCRRLDNIEFNENLREIKDESFEFTSIKNLDLRKTKVEYIGYLAFANNIELENIIFPKNLKVIDKMAFNKCHNTKSIEFNDELVTIGEKAFNLNNKLKSIKLGENWSI